MNDKKAHDQLKKINSQRNLIGVGGYKNSRRDKNDNHDKFNTAMGEMNKLSEEQKVKDNE